MFPMTSTIWAYDQFLPGGLFKDAIFPDGIDKQLVVDTIMIKNGELEPLYKDADFMQWACSSWAKKWFPSFERWLLALTEDYNPLHNYDRFEEIEEEHDNATAGKMDGTTKDHTTSTNTRSAFNSDKYEPHDRNELDSSGTTGSTTSGSDKGTFGRKAHLYGNIGVTTSAQMLEGEIEVRRYNIYDLIADCFTTELCLLIY